MKHFATLFRSVDETTKTTEKVKALVRFFEVASDEDKLWAIGLFTHRRPRRTVKTSLLRNWASEVANIPSWIFEESYHIVGDLAETIALVLPDGTKQEDKDLNYWIEYLINLRGQEEEAIKTAILQAWNILPKEERFIFNKLITGGWRIGVSQKLITKALAKYLDVDEATIAHRLMGDWTPRTTTFNRLLLEDHASDQLSKPYPFIWPTR
jgi:DNA ligase-1